MRYVTRRKSPPKPTSPSALHSSADASKPQPFQLLIMIKNPDIPHNHQKEAEPSRQAMKMPQNNSKKSSSNNNGKPKRNSVAINNLVDVDQRPQNRGHVTHGRHLKKPPTLVESEISGF
ncbi:3800_t:CDS:2 [Ambispora gerdemannii]|uniref:3800_t:CDS:1 n=1 Tax=Ambispora gerdemannii TaxID=144530 RepID=A0A9N8WNS2_9GLOM|nr:3800_t:CDS:2 [Ambispora gerdemannii]